MKSFRLIALITIQLFVLHTKSQTPYGDSLQSIYAQAHDSLKIFYLNEIGWEYMTVSQFDKGEWYANEAIKLAEQKQDQDGLGDAYNLLGSIANNKGNQVKAIGFHEKALAIRQSIKDTKGIAASINNIGNVYNYIGEYDNALLQFNKVLEIWKNVGDSAAIATTLGNISVSNFYKGNFEDAISFQLQTAAIRERIHDRKLPSTYSNISAMYREIGNHQKSEEFALKCLELAKKSDNPGEIASAYVNLGVIAKNKKDYQQSLTYLHQAYGIYNTTAYAYGLINVMGNLARLHETTNRLDSAIFYMKNSIDLAESTGNNTSLIDNLSTYSDILIKQNNPHEAIKQLKRAEEICLRDHDQNDYRDILRKLSNAYATAGDFKNAYTYGNLHTALSDSLFQVDMNEKMAEMQTRFDVQQMKNDNAQLEQSNRISKLEAEKSKTMFFASIAAAILLLVAGVMLFLRYRSRQQLKLVSEVAHQQKLGIAAVIEAQEEERKRIARELHDSIGQQLGALKMQLDSTEQKDTSQLLDQTIKEVRGISHQMLPVTLEKVGLAPALEELLSQSLHGSSISYHFDELGKTPKLNSTIELTLYRIAQELISNIIKHSKANQVNLQLISTKNQILLKCEDNGVGLSSKGTSSGLGMLNMSTRIQNIGGDISMEQGTPDGLITTLRIPLAS